MTDYCFLMAGVPIPVYMRHTMLCLVTAKVEGGSSEVREY